MKSTAKKALFPWFVFFQAKENWALALTVYYSDYILRLLQTEDGWPLKGSDEQLARWLLERDGLLDMSKDQEGTSVIVRSGPLKELENIITKADCQNRNGQITLDLFGW